MLNPSKKKLEIQTRTVLKKNLAKNRGTVAIRKELEDAWASAEIK